MIDSVFLELLYSVLLTSLLGEIRWLLPKIVTDLLILSLSDNA